MQPRALLVMLVAGVACQSPFTADAGGRAVTITLSAASPQTPLATQGPFISVVDSIALEITPSGGVPLRFGRRLTRRETGAAFEVTLPDGSAQFAASVLSARQRVLYSGTNSASIGQDDFSVDVPLVAQGPVMLIEPDTITVLVYLKPGTATYGSALVRVYNPGSGLLGFSISNSSPEATQQCASVRCFRVSRPSSVPAGQSIALCVDSVRAFQTAIPLTFTAREGEALPVVIRTEPSSTPTPDTCQS